MGLQFSIYIILLYITVISSEVQRSREIYQSRSLHSTAFQSRWRF